VSGTRERGDSRSTREAAGTVGAGASAWRWPTRWPEDRPSPGRTALFPKRLRPAAAFAAGVRWTVSTGVRVPGGASHRWKRLDLSASTPSPALLAGFARPVWSSDVAWPVW